MKLSAAQREQFDRDGYLFFPGQFTREEMQGPAARSTRRPCPSGIGGKPHEMLSLRESRMTRLECCHCGLDPQSTQRSFGARWHRGACAHFRRGVDAGSSPA